ncbi:MAG: hypothetical protein Q8Q12_13485 [bacterium]|nr:hypothetical protein [bacterium]
MIERAIENWLTNTTERNYQAPFCQVLLREGQKIIHVSTHGPMEQGKDIVTVDPDGIPCAYQLKSGKIDLAKWHAIRGQVVDLIELPVSHPSVDKGKGHRSFLVTNGIITDPVRQQIVDINEDNRRRARGCSNLDVIAGTALAKKFIDAQGRFMPEEPTDFQAFLKLFLADGTDFLDKGTYFRFLNDCIFSDAGGRKGTATDAISSSVIIVSYLLDPYQRCKNYYALFEAWTCLGACIARHAHRSRLADTEFGPSLELVISEIVRNLSLLRDEALNRPHLLEGSPIGDGALVYQARATIVLGASAALDCYGSSREAPRPRDGKLLDVIRRNIRRLAFWCEWFFPHLFWVIKYLELQGDRTAAEFLLRKALRLTVDLNSPGKAAGSPSPYYSPKDLLDFTLEAGLGRSEPDIDFGQFCGSSFILAPLVEMLARRGERRFLQDSWPAISRIFMKEFRPDNPEDTFLWRAEQGANHEEQPRSPESWVRLVQGANDVSGVPELLAKHAKLLRFLILACPHRAQPKIIALLDKVS